MFDSIEGVTVAGTRSVGVAVFGVKLTNPMEIFVAGCYDLQRVYIHKAMGELTASCY